MIVEYVRYEVPAARHVEFLEAYRAAAAQLASSVQCQRYEISQGIEEPDNFIVRIEWDSVERHEQGFRSCPEFRAFYALVKPFFAAIVEMKHYRVDSSGRGASTDVLA